MLTKTQVLEPLARLRTDEVVVATMSVVRPWAQLSDSDLDFASADSAMGHAADLALGIAMAQPRRRVLCLNGDGSMLMSLGTLVTIIASGVRNLILFVIDNGTYEITGNQPTPGAVDFVAMAQAAGFRRAYRFDEADAYEAALPDLLCGDGPVFACLHVEPGQEGPISRSTAEEARYLKTSLADWSRTLRAALLKSV
ncbi:MAG: thiamine pyrophosphate-binding protein [Bacteroidetes bacterium]|nr:thiamine pyrophosphate-binding protein [Bacteroidota bacterium]